MKKTFIVLMVFFSPFLYGQNNEVGMVKLIKGGLLNDNLPLKVGDTLQEGDIVRTTSGSMAKILMDDQTLITLGPDSDLQIKSYREVELKRQNLVRLIKGKMRVLVKEMAKEGESLKFDAQQVSLGVRGTEFLVNTYTFGGSPATDTLLVKGKLAARGAGFNGFTMEPGQYFNSQELARNGLKALKQVGPGVLQKLKNASDAFLPEIKGESGLKNLDEFFKKEFNLAASAAGAAVGVASGLMGKAASLGTGSQENEKAVRAVKKVKNENLKDKKNKTAVKGPLDFKYDLKKEPWDIRDAVMNRSKNLKDNVCFYYFYKKIPGSGEAERFRRERDCDEYEFDL